MPLPALAAPAALGWPDCGWLEAAPALWEPVLAAPVWLDVLLCCCEACALLMSPLCGCVVLGVADVPLCEVLDCDCDALLAWPACCSLDCPELGVCCASDIAPISNKLRPKVSALFINSIPPKGFNSFAAAIGYQALAADGCEKAH